MSETDPTRSGAEGETPEPPPLKEVLKEIDDLLRELGIDPEEKPEPTGDPELDALLASLETPTEPNPPPKPPPVVEDPAEPPVVAPPVEVTLEAILAGEPRTIATLERGDAQAWELLFDAMEGASAPRPCLTAMLLRQAAVRAWMATASKAVEGLYGNGEVEARLAAFARWLEGGLDALEESDRPRAALALWRLDQRCESEDPARAGVELMPRLRAAYGETSVEVALGWLAVSYRALEVGATLEALTAAGQASRLCKVYAGVAGEVPGEAVPQRLAVAALLGLGRYGEALDAFQVCAAYSDCSQRAIRGPDAPAPEQDSALARARWQLQRLALTARVSDARWLLALAELTEREAGFTRSLLWGRLLSSADAACSGGSQEPLAALYRGCVEAGLTWVAQRLEGKLASHPQ